MLGADQSVRPADLPAETTTKLLTIAQSDQGLYPFTSQMRVRAAADYVGHLRALLRGERPASVGFAEYDLRRPRC